jgi:hypothetical protein
MFALFLLNQMLFIMFTASYMYSKVPFFIHKCRAMYR